MTSIALTDTQRKDLIRAMKREIHPSRKLRMPIVLLVQHGFLRSRWSCLLLAWHLLAVWMKLARQEGIFS